MKNSANKVIASSNQWNFVICWIRMVLAIVIWRQVRLMSCITFLEAFREATGLKDTMSSTLVRPKVSCSVCTGFDSCLHSPLEWNTIIPCNWTLRDDEGHRLMLQFYFHLCWTLLFHFHLLLTCFYFDHFRNMQLSISFHFWLNMCLSFTFHFYLNMWLPLLFHTCLCLALCMC